MSDQLLQFRGRRELVERVILTKSIFSEAIKGMLNDYLTWGGFPEVWIYRSREKLVSLLETMFYRDIMERHKIRETAVFLELARLTISNYAYPITWHSLRRTMRSIGVDVDVKTVINYVEYMH